MNAAMQNKLRSLEKRAAAMTVGEELKFLCFSDFTADGRVISGHPAAAAEPLIGLTYAEVKLRVRHVIKIYGGFDANLVGR